VSRWSSSLAFGSSYSRTDKPAAAGIGERLAPDYQHRGALNALHFAQGFAGCLIVLPLRISLVKDRDGPESVIDFSRLFYQLGGLVNRP